MFLPESFLIKNVTKHTWLIILDLIARFQSYIQSVVVRVFHLTCVGSLNSMQSKQAMLYYILLNIDFFVTRRKELIKFLFWIVAILFPSRKIISITKCFCQNFLEYLDDASTNSIMKKGGIIIWHDQNLLHLS